MLGFSNRKAEYTVGLARSDLDLDGLAALPDDEVKVRLTALLGIGDWTAEWFLARHLGRPDAWPAGDLGLRKAVGRFYLDGRDPSVEETRALGERFTPHGNLTAHYLLTGMRVMRLTYEVRRDGLPTQELLEELVEAARKRGESEIQVETTHEAGDAWIRAGFTEVARTLTASVDVLGGRLGPATDPSFGSIHVQTDDVDAVERAIRQFVPRLPGGSKGSVVLPPRDGWVGVFDELTDREPEMLRRLARELSDRMGAFVLALGAEEGRVVRYIAYERGRVVDEYLSIPEFHGPLPPGEVIALGSESTPHGTDDRRRCRGNPRRGADGSRPGRASARERADRPNRRSLWHSGRPRRL